MLKGLLGDSAGSRFFSGAMISLLTACVSAPPSVTDVPDAVPQAHIQRISLVTGDLKLSRRMWVEAFDYRVVFDAPGMRGRELADAYNLDDGALVDLVILAPPQGILAPYVDLLGVSGQTLQPLRTDPPGSPPRAGDHRLIVHVPDIYEACRLIEGMGLPVLQSPKHFRGAQVERGAFGAVSAPDLEAVVVSPDGTRIQLVSFSAGGPENCYLDCTPETSTGSPSMTLGR